MPSATPDAASQPLPGVVHDPRALPQDDPRRKPARDCRLLFPALVRVLPAAALAQPIDEPSNHEHGHQEYDDHAHAHEHIGENDGRAAVDAHRRPVGDLHQYLCRVSRADRLPGSCINLPVISWEAANRGSPPTGNGL